MLQKLSRIFEISGKRHVFPEVCKTQFLNAASRVFSKILAQHSIVLPEHTVKKLFVRFVPFSGGSSFG
jgi:hypothetical protein